MKLHALVTIVALIIACGVLSSTLDTYFASTTAGGSDLLEILLGEMRSVFADLALVRADDYFHSGVRHIQCDHKEHEEAEHLEDEMEGEVHPPPRDYISWLNEEIHPRHHTHLSGGSLREIFPLIGAAIALDPHNEEAYLVGAYWLERGGKNTEAHGVLQQGIRENPDSYLLYMDLGRHFFQKEGDNTKAIHMLNNALANWDASVAGGEEPDQLARSTSLLYLGTIYENEGKVEEAIKYYEEVLKQYPDREGLRKKISALSGDRTSH